MIDFDLVTRATEYSLRSLRERTQTCCPSLFMIESFLCPDLVSKLHEFISEYPDKNWVTEYGQSERNRMKLNWVPETVIEETHMVLENLTIAINEIFNRHDTFMGITVWKDREGYHIPKHVDNDAIDIALQLYLSPESGDFATEFLHNNEIIKAKYMQNSGYLLGDKVIHSMTTPVSADHTRYSLYAIWRR